MAHGYGAGADAYLVTYRKEPLEVCLGFPVLTSDFGGPSTWGNDTSRTAMTAAATWMMSQPGAMTDKVSLYGGSMGCLTVLNWAISNPTKVASIVLVLPAVSLADLHDNRQISTPGDIAAFIDTAYGNHAGYVAALPTHDPNTTANRAALAALPIQVWYSTNDPIADPTIAQSFAAATGAELRSLGAVGHSASTLDYDRMRNFVLAH
jgi:predicted alpha/beta hydrolase family esterase